jgi:hypothetical protein
VTFGEGLLQARGQIVFILALAISTGVIIYLESLDTDSRIRSRVEDSLARERGGSGASQALRDRAGVTLRRAEEAYSAAPNVAESRAALLVALAGAVELGALDRDEARSRAEGIVQALEREAGPVPPILASALTAAAAAFPSLQDRIARLP